MSNFVITLIIAIVLMLLALIGLGIGWILTGKSFSRGSCGYNPNKKKSRCDSNSSCDLCAPEKKEKNERNIK